MIAGRFTEKDRDLFLELVEDLNRIGRADPVRAMRRIAGFREVCEQNAFAAGVDRGKSLATLAAQPKDSTNG